MSVDDFAGGRFDELRDLLARAASLGYPVQGGYAFCRIFEGGENVAACWWVGSDHPENEAETGSLVFSDGTGTYRPLTAVGPVAWSEGMRMAAALYAGRVAGDVGGAAVSVTTEALLEAGAVVPLGSTVVRADLADELRARPTAIPRWPTGPWSGWSLDTVGGRGPVDGVPRLRPAETGSPRSASPASAPSASRPGRWCTIRPTATTPWRWSRTSSGCRGWRSRGSARPRTASTRSATG